jgi:hypothetical protein
MSRFSAALLVALVAVTALAAPADLAPRYLASGFVIDPAVATDGDSFLAVWRDTRDGRTTIRARRIQNDATLSDYTGFILGDAPDAISAPAVVWNGSTYLVAWRRDRGFATAVVSRDGRLLATEQHAGPAGFAGDYPLALASNGTKQLVVVDVDHRLYATFLAPDANGASGWFPIPGGTGQGAPSVASNGRDFLVTWSDFDSGFSVIQGMRVSDAGVPLDHDALAIARTAIPGVSYRAESSFPVVAWDGAHYVVVWTTDGVRARSIDAAGVMSDEQLLAASGEHAAIVPIANGLLLAWNVLHPQQYGAMYDLTVATLRGDALTQQSTFTAAFALSPIRPALASNGDALVIIRPDQSIDSRKQYDALFAGVNEPLAGARRLFLSIAAFGQYAPRILTSDNGFLATWAESVPQFSIPYSGLGISRNFVAPVALDATPRAAATAISDDIYGVPGSRGAFANGRYLLVWPTFEPPLTRTIGTLVDEAGTVVKAPFVIETNTYGSFGHNPVVVSDGTSFLVIDFIETTGTFAITARRVASDGTLGERLTLIDALPFAPYALNGSMAFGRLALAWHEFNGSPLETIAELTSDLRPIRAPLTAALPVASDVVVAPDTTFIASFNSFPNQARVDLVRKGAVSASVELPAIGRVVTGSATWSGTDLVAAWTEEIDGGSLLRLARISTNGELRSVTTLAQSPNPAEGVAVASANGHVLLAYGRNDPNTVYGNANRIELTLDPSPRRRSTTR